MHLAMQIDACGTDGEVIKIQMPSEGELSDIVLAGEKQWKSRIGAYFLLFVYIYVLFPFDVSG